MSHTKRKVFLLFYFFICVVPFALPVFAEKDTIVYDADTLLEVIGEGREVTIDGGIIDGDLDFTKLDYEANTNDSRVVHVQCQIHIVNSEIRGKINTHTLAPFTKTVFNKTLNLSGTEILGDSFFHYAQFSSEARFNMTQFSGNTYFIRTQFSGRANFIAAKFYGDAGFSMTQFHGSAEFFMAQFSGETDFFAARFHEYAGFFKTQFSGETNFGSSEFHGRAFFRETMFTGEIGFGFTEFHEFAVFYKTQFHGRTDFSYAKFHESVNFTELNFTKGISFRGTQFSRGADFKRVKFSGETDYDNAEFHGYAEFSETRFSEWTSFVRANFFGSTNFPRTQFSERVDFSGVNFFEVLDFTKAHFSERATFVETNFNKLADFSEVHFNKQISFMKSKFYGDSTFSGAEFTEIALFTNTNFSGMANFEYTIFQTIADFRDTNFQTVSFSGVPAAIFRDIADFRRSKINNAYLNGTRFSHVDFSGADFNTTLDLEDTVYSSMKLNWKEVADKIKPENDPEVFRSLEENFRSLKRLDYANGAFYQCKIAERLNKSPVMQYLEIIFLDWSYGYGVRPQNVVIVSAVLILIFSLAYLSTDAMILDRSKKEEGKLAIRLKEFPIASSKQEKDGIKINEECSIIDRFRHALGFSFSVFTKIGFGNIYGTSNVKPYQIIEWLLGFVMISLLGYTLSKTIPILHLLFTGVF